MRVRNLTPEIDGPVRIMGIVLSSTTGSAMVQDIYDDIEHAKSILVIVEGKLIEDEKYILIGNILERVSDSGKEIVLDASLAYNMNKLDVKLYKEALELEEQVIEVLTR